MELRLGQPAAGQAPQFIPEALFLLNIKQNLPLLRNSIKLQIPIIAIVNSDADPLGIKYPIPANDASHPEIYKGLLVAVAEGPSHQEQKLLMVSAPLPHRK